jgi:hypothetical protein
MLAGNRVEFKTKVAGIRREGRRLMPGCQPAAKRKPMRKHGCEAGLEMAALVQPVEAPNKRTIAWI